MSKRPSMDMSHFVAFLFVMVVISLCIHPSVCFKFESGPPDQQIFVLGANSTNVTMIWRFTLVKDEYFARLAVHRIDPAAKSATVYSKQVSLPGLFNTTFYTVNTNIRHGPSSGYLVFTIKDIMKQIDNDDKSHFDPLSLEYVTYKLNIVLQVGQRNPQHPSQTKSFLYYHPGIPRIYMQSDKQVMCRDETINITCNATIGNPAKTTFMFFVNGIQNKTKVGTLNGNERKTTVSIKLSKAGNKTFKCQAKNDAGLSAMSNAANITVKGPPVITNCANEKAIKGEFLSWSCRAGNPLLTASWYKGDMLKSPDWTFNISSVIENDAGTYTFNVSGKNECPTRKILNLTVQYQPVIHPPRNDCMQISVEEGKDKLIFCNTTGVPKPSIVWKRDGKDLREVDNPLVLKNVTKKQKGNYTCTAYNGIKKNATACWILNVKYKPDELKIANMKDGALDVDKGQPINITCIANGYPKPRYHWKFNDKTLDIALNTVNISSADHNDHAGVYMCTAINSEGNRTIDVTLHVNYIEDVLCNAKPVPVKENELITLNCSATGYPLYVNYTWTVTDTVFHGPMTIVNATYSLNALNATCTAKNKFGSKKCARNINVHHKPYNVQVLLQTQEVNISDSFNLTCSASVSNPAGSYTWSLNGKVLFGETNRMLTKTNVTAADAGEYTCTVTNYLGSGTSNKAVINIRRPPRIQCSPFHFVTVNTSQLISCEAEGYPKPKYAARFNGKTYSDSTFTIDHVTKDLNGSIIHCSAFNLLGSVSCNTTLIVRYFDCNNVAFEVTDGPKGKCVTGTLSDGYPVPNITCSSQENLNITLGGQKNYSLCGKRNSTTNCSLGNVARRCGFTVQVYEEVAEYRYNGRFNCSSCKHGASLGNRTSTEFKELEDKCNKMMALAYKRTKYVFSTKVIAFWPGSVIVEFQLNLIANVADPLSPLKELLRKSGWTLEGLTIDPKSIKAGPYVPSTTATPPTTTPTTEAETEGSDGIGQDAIIAIIVVVVVIVLLSIILLIWYFWRKKKKEKINEDYTPEDGNGNNRPISARDNPGLSETPPTYDKVDRRSDINGQPTNNNPTNTGTSDLYAAVDKSKKKKKRKEGELIYADLSESRPNGDNNQGTSGTELQPLSSSGHIPAKHESDYADIAGFKSPGNADVKFAGENQADSQHQDNSSAASQADLSTARDNTTMTTVSL